MPYAIGTECITCKSTLCVDVCPVDAFRDASCQLVICPETCIECGVCEPECPVAAIISPGNEDSTVEKILKINAVLSKHSPIIVKSLNTERSIKVQSLKGGTHE